MNARASGASMKSSPPVAYHSSHPFAIDRSDPSSVNSPSKPGFAIQDAPATVALGEREGSQAKKATMPIVLASPAMHMVRSFVPLRMEAPFLIGAFTPV